MNNFIMFAEQTSNFQPRSEPGCALKKNEASSVPVSDTITFFSGNVESALVVREGDPCIDSAICCNKKEIYLCDFKQGFTEV